MQNVGQMAAGVSRRTPYIYFVAAVNQSAAFADTGAGMRYVGVAVNGAFGECFFQFGDAASVVVMVVGNPDLAKSEPVLFEVAEYRAGLPGVNAYCGSLTFD